MLLLNHCSQNPRQATSHLWDLSSGLELFLYLEALGLNFVFLI